MQFKLYKMLVELNRKNICSQTIYSVKVKHFLGMKQMWGIGLTFALYKYWVSLYYICSIKKNKKKNSFLMSFAHC